MPRRAFGLSKRVSGIARIVCSYNLPDVRLHFTGGDVTIIFEQLSCLGFDLGEILLIPRKDLRLVDVLLDFDVVSEPLL
jgi:hypothetical protein